MAECTNNDGLQVAEQFYNTGSRIIGREVTNANLLLGAGLYSNVLAVGSSNLPTAHAYIVENKINPEDDTIVQFATPEVATQGRFSYRTFDGAKFSNWVQLANTTDLDLDGKYALINGSNIPAGMYWQNLKSGDSQKWNGQNYLDQTLTTSTSFLMAYNPITDSWQPAPNYVVKAYLDTQISDVEGLQAALAGKVNLDGSNSTGALAGAIARQHDAVTLGANNAGLSLVNQILSIAAGYAMLTNNQIAQFTEAYNLRHTHLNKAILDTILTLNISQFINDVPYASESWSNGRFLPLNDPRIINWEAAFNAIGLPLSNLNTNDKTSLINAINEALASSNAYTAGDHILIDSNKRISAVLDITNPLRDKNGAARISVGSNTVTDDFIFYSRFSNAVEFSWRDASGNKHMSLNSGGVLRVDSLAGVGNKLLYRDLSGSIFATNIDINDLATMTWVDSNFARKIGNYQGMTVGNSTLWNGLAADWTTNNTNPIDVIGWDNTAQVNRPINRNGLLSWLNLQNDYAYRDSSNILNPVLWRTNLSVYSENDVNVLLATKANTSGNYQGLIVGNSTLWNGQFYADTGNTNITRVMTYNGNSNRWEFSGASDFSNWLGINTSWNLQQVTNNGASTTHNITIQSTVYGDNSVFGSSDYAIRTIYGGGLWRLRANGILSSDNDADASLIPANGIYSKGAITSNNIINAQQFIANNGGLVINGQGGVNANTTKIFFNNPFASIGWAISQGFNNATQEGIGFGTWDGSVYSSKVHISTNGTISTENHGTSADWINKLGAGSNISLLNNDIGYATETWVTNNFASNTALGNYVNKAGDTMSGLLSLPEANFIGLQTGFKIGKTLTVASSDVANWTFTNRNDTFFGEHVNDLIFWGDRVGGYYVPLIFRNNGNVILASGKNAISGNVGIGTANPQAKLHVNGNIITDNATAPNHAVAFGQLANYALLSQVPTNNNQLANGANYITSAALAGYALVSQIPTDNAQLANGAGYITAASLPTVNNGTLTFSVSSDFATGAFSFSANQAGNTNAPLALSGAIKSDIALGVNAYNSLGNYMLNNHTITINGVTQFLSNNPIFTVSATATTTVEALPPQGGGNIPIKMNKTRVSVEAGTSYQIDDGNFEGDELVIVPCGSSFDIGIDMRWMDYCMNEYDSLGFIDLRPRHFWWSTKDKRWIDVTT